MIKKKKSIGLRDLWSFYFNVENDKENLGLLDLWSIRKRMIEPNLFKLGFVFYPKILHLCMDKVKVKVQV